MLVPVMMYEESLFSSTGSAPTPHKKCDDKLHTASLSPAAYTGRYFLNICRTRGSRALNTGKRRRNHQRPPSRMQVETITNNVFVNVFPCVRSPPTPADKERALVARSGDECRNERPLAPTSTPCSRETAVQLQTIEKPARVVVRRQRPHCPPFVVTVPPIFPPAFFTANKAWCHLREEVRCYWPWCWRRPSSTGRGKQRMAKNFRTSHA